jgi:hypothetical protein
MERSEQNILSGNTGLLANKRDGQERLKAVVPMVLNRLAISVSCTSVVTSGSKRMP